ncbi:single-stranded DNA-binding protein [Leifsonia sp. F6_8S_P_1B]|uniref:Single-stranded DNA-binding protein n=1 Tax=Leifsonia williamsii TaxID=3035919 RepID=A0ABT8KG46_9MICO|nr:single-stranded DNA-binding protein [Leifsonia williamsii]MDN4616433.1 single-stranded DNA-binding protein [Leifsonia williamsii]
MTSIAFTGNLTETPILRYTQAGKAVANLNVAVNRKRGESEETDFHRVTVWGEMAEHVAQFDKGTRVMVIGRLTSRQYETQAGEKRTGWEVTADAIGPDLRFATAVVAKTASRPTSAPQTPESSVWDDPAPSFNDSTPF